MSNTVDITEQNSGEEYDQSTSVLKSILYLYYEISRDCLPLGDWDRADSEGFNPYRYLDIQYQCEYVLRDDEELSLMHEGSAVLLLCRLAQLYDLDETTGSNTMQVFCNIEERSAEERHLKVIAPELFKIHSVFESGVIAKNNYIQSAFRAAFTGNFESFIGALKEVRLHVIGRVIRQL